MIIVAITRYFTYPKLKKKAMLQYKEKAFKQLLEKNISLFSDTSTSTYISAFTNDAIMIEDNYLKTMFELIQSIGSIAQVIAQLGVMIVGAWMVLNKVGNLTLGMVIAFTNLMNFVIQPLALIPRFLGQRKSGLALIEKLMNNLQNDAKDERIQLENIKTPPLLTGENVNYSYIDGKVTLKTLSYKFKPNKSYAIVGGSGYGKTTLLNLFTGSHHHYEGDV